MKARTPILAFFLTETVVLMAVVTPLVHFRSLAERLLLSSTAHLPDLATDEPFYIFARSVLMVLVLQVSFAFRDLYRWSVIVRPQLVVVRLIEGVITALIALPLLHYLLGAADRNLELGGDLLRLQIHLFLIVAGTGAAFLAAYGLRMRWPRWVEGTGLAERIALVGRGPLIDILEEELRRRHDPSLILLGFLDDPESAQPGRQLLGPPEQAAELGVQHELHRLVVEASTTLSDEALLRLRLAGIHITDASSFYERVTGRVSPESLWQTDLFLTSTPVSLAYRVAKRFLDILFATIGLILAAPLLVFVAVLVKLESRGPIFYTQERMGAATRTFALSKFRSMRADAETSSGPVWASRNDSRITRVGRWLRKLRVDEIPQLVAVLRNDMTLVGPRPERPFFVDELEQQIPHYGRRHLVKPGVTGWAQINYSYGNTVDDAFIKLQFDLYYIKHRNLALDIAILLRTIKVVVLQQGAM